MADLVGRSELALVLELATTSDRRDLSAESFTREEAERIAADVGVSPEKFRAALAHVRSAELGSGNLLGPEAHLSAETRLPHPVGATDARRAIAIGQAAMPRLRGEIVEVGDDIWRSSSRWTLIQVASDRSRTEITVSAERSLTKMVFVLGGTLAGGFLGGQLGALLASGLAGEVSPIVALGIGVGGLAGLAGGLSAGVALWRSMARRLQHRMFLATDRIRERLADSLRAAPPTNDPQ